VRVKSFDWNFTGWTAIVFYAVCGLLLLLWPSLALTIANYALAATLCAVALVMIAGYIRGEALDGMLNYGLAKGLILLLIGIVLFVRSDILIALLPFLWGVAMLAGGFAKVQVAFDLNRVDRERWWLMLLGALLSFVLGIIAVTKPLFLADVITQFIGASLLLEALLDLMALLTIRREVKKMNV
jgi:uncharacterized membrane protein HdeD (DUF308 family)